MNGSQIAKRAVLIGPGDVAAVRAAGGLPAGMMTMKGESGMAEVEEAAAVEAAEYGGTHYLLGRWSEETSTTYHANGNAQAWSVIPITRTEQQARYAVIRVPASGWHRLDPALTPDPL